MNLPADFNKDGPSAADLAAIEAEWPVIEAELGVLDAEIAALGTTGGPSPLDWRRLRHARRRLLAELGHRAAVDDGPALVPSSEGGAA
jgi:Family of unknown function (DUF6284)